MLVFDRPSGEILLPQFWINDRISIYNSDWMRTCKREHHVRRRESAGRPTLHQVLKVLLDQDVLLTVYQCQIRVFSPLGTEFVPFIVNFRF
jgi:hypothetical protein